MTIVAACQKGLLPIKLATQKKEKKEKKRKKGAVLTAETHKLRIARFCVLLARLSCYYYSHTLTYDY